MVEMAKKNVAVENNGGILFVCMDSDVAEKVKAAPWSHGLYYQGGDHYDLFPCPRYNVADIIAQIEEWAQPVPQGGPQESDVS